MTSLDKLFEMVQMATQDEPEYKSPDIDKQYDVKNDDEVQQGTVTSDLEADIAKYYHITDPDTGYRYNIPMLSTGDPRYMHKYIEYMKTKESNPELFEKILRWA